jgi:hypothetical protein
MHGAGECHNRVHCEPAHGSGGLLLQHTCALAPSAHESMFAEYMLTKVMAMERTSCSINKACFSGVDVFHQLLRIAALFEGN